jgi:hypothetical protein
MPGPRSGSAPVARAPAAARWVRARRAPYPGPVQTMFANGVVVVWAVALIFAPGLLYATFRRSTPLVMAAGAMVTMVVVAIVSTLVSATGYSPVPGLLVLGAFLALVLAAAVVRVMAGAFRRAGARRVTSGSPLRAVAVVTAVGLLGLWMLAPLALVLHRHGVDFGLLTFGNADESNYVLAAQNMVAAGFDDSHHLANGQVGQIARTNYVGATTMLVWLSAITPLGPAQVALGSMAVAAALAAISLWALATEIWPTLPPVAALPGVVIVSTSGVAAYSYANYFLGAELGLATVCATLAGIVTLSRRWSWPGATATAAAGGYGVYAYGHIGLLILVVAVPLGAFVAWVTVGLHEVLRAAARVAVACMTAAVLALPIVSVAYALMRAQSNAHEGWPLPPMDPFRALLWPQGIGRPASGLIVVVGWLLVLAILFGTIWAAARRPDERRSAVLAGLVLLGGAVVVAGAAAVYGAERYQSWKMLQLLMPVALVAALPAVGLFVVGTSRAGSIVLSAVAGAALLGPWLQWQDVLRAPDTAAVTSSNLQRSTEAIRERDIVAVNVWLPEINQTMMAGAMLSDTAVVLSQQTYYPPLVSTKTCTLTVRSMLPPGHHDVIRLSGDYVLLNRPNACLVGR